MSQMTTTSEQSPQFYSTLESLIKTLPIEKTSDFISFRTTFMNNFDFERVRELARSQ